MPLTLFLAADDSYVVPLAVTIYSALVNLAPALPAEIHVIDTGISEPNRQRIEQVVRKARAGTRIAWVRPDLARLQALCATDGFGPSASARFLVAELVPESCEKVLYLDSDVVVNADLAELWHQDIQGFSVRAVNDYAMPSFRVRFGATAPLTLIDPESEYFNSGVLLINPKWWRRERVSERAISHLERYKGMLIYPDQDALNLALRDTWGSLHPSWNIQTAIHVMDRWEATPFREKMRSMLPDLSSFRGIIHFTGAPKPWMEWYPEKSHRIFGGYLVRSGWMEGQ